MIIVFSCGVCLRSGLLLQAWTKLGNNFGMSKYFCNYYPNSG